MGGQPVRGAGYQPSACQESQETYLLMVGHSGSSVSSWWQL